MGKRIIKDMLPEEFIQLGRELALHHDPELYKLIGEGNDFTERLGAVAAYCEILLDGLYDEDDLRKIADRCTRKLQEKRTLILRLN